MARQRSTLARLAALALVAGLALPIGLGYLGAYHLAFDAFSHFRLHLAALLGLCVVPLLLLRLRPEAFVAALLAGMVTGGTVGALPFATSARVSAAPEAAIGDTAIYRLLHMNLRYDNATPELALSLIGELRPDVVTLNEVSEAWAERLEPLAETYPHRIVCDPPSRVGGAAILSRRPFAADTAPRCEDRGAMAVARIDFGGRRADVATLHLGWPWPFAQPWQIPRVRPVLARLDGTAIVAGDLNAVPWSHAARDLAAAGGLRIQRGTGPTWLFLRMPDALRRWVGLPIDQVMVAGAVLPLGIERQQGVGSDHLPLLFTFSLLREEQPAPVLRAGLGGG